MLDQIYSLSLMRIIIDTVILKPVCTGDMYVGKDSMTLRSLLVFAKIMDINKNNKEIRKNNK